LAARRFLWIIAILILLVVAAALAYRLLGDRLIRMAMVPSAEFKPAPPAPVGIYARPDMWLARPGIARDPSRWTPPGVTRGDAQSASVFFIHPTSYLERDRWNAPIDDAESQRRARLFVRSQASVFNDVGEVWAPRYRQAAFGAFLTTRRDAQMALDLAYRDVAAAFDAFLAQAPGDRPIILAGHSQGAFHLIRLLAERVAGRPAAQRIAAAYAVGWPISVTVDLPGLGLPACGSAGQPACILAWQSFGEPADTDLITEVFDASVGPEGRRRAGSDMLCVNPVSGTRDGTADAAANLGALIPNAELTQGRLVAPGVAARCGPRGFLLIGEDAPNLGPYVLPGNNYHVYDFALFWASIRADAAARLAAFEG